MKKLLALLFVIFLSANVSKAVDRFHVNDNAVEKVFAQGIELNLTNLEEPAFLKVMNFTENATLAPKGGDNAVVAFVLCWFLGGLGIHRAYLGTKAIVVVGYILTCGGIFGVVPFVDWIMLLVGIINDDISDYVDNPAFFMW